jgi:putative tricarboxylic transport membrane protein
MQFVTKGDFRALAVSSDKRLDAAPDVPTYKESGYDVVQGSWRGIFAPPTMPEHALRFWYDALGKAVKTATFQEAAKKYGWQVTYLAGDDFKGFLTQETASLQQVLNQVGLIKK